MSTQRGDTWFQTTEPLRSLNNPFHPVLPMGELA